MSWTEAIGDRVNEQVRLRVLLVIIVLFLASGFASFNEFRYFIWGRTTRAVVVAQSDSDRKGDVLIVIKYALLDQDDNIRIESDSVMKAWQETLTDSFKPVNPSSPLANVRSNKGVTVPVQYIPGSAGSSRLIGNNDKWLAAPFLLCAGALVVMSLVIARQSMRYERTKVKYPGH